MINILHISALLLGFSAYYFSDVNSGSGFYSILLPVIVLVSFIYGIVVTINMLYKLRRASTNNSKSNDILLASLKEHGMLDNGADVVSVLQPTAMKTDNGTEATAYKTPTQSTNNISKPFLEPEPTPATEQAEVVQSQQEINQQQWEDPDNWSEPGFVSIYFSPLDSRTWVPRQGTFIGKKLNLAKIAGIYWLYGLCFVALLLIVGFLELL